MGGSGSMEMAALNSIHDILCAAVIQIISMTTHMAKAITSHMAYMYTKRGNSHNPCYKPTKMGTDTGHSGSMEIAAVSSLHDIFHATVFHIIGMPT